MPADRHSRMGVVVIGRNEGARLTRCLHSVMGHSRWIVYVDSGSTDSSIDVARALGAAVCELDMRQPFTAARARNEGVRNLIRLAPDVEFVQFVDGDCEVVDRWPEAAIAFMFEHPGMAVVCGRLRERFPERSVYNLLCDMEWNTPIGEAKACGGIALIRRSALQEVGGFNASLIAGEEPELCVRLRAKGWRIWRLDAEMAIHDAAMTRWGQWWTRCVRTGFAYSEGVRLHGASPERHWVRESRSAWSWGAGLPSAVLVGTLMVGPIALAGLAVYPAQVARLASRETGAARQRWLRAFFLVAGKFPEVVGQAKALVQRARGQRARLIEHK